MAVSRLNLGTTNQVLVKAAAGQTSNILEAQNSSGTVVAGLSQAGVWSGSAAPGLVLLNTTSFSGVASVSLPAATFSATYNNYKIYLSGVIATAGVVQGRLRVGGADNSTASSYVRQIINADDGSLSSNRDTNNLFDFGAFNTTLVNALELDLINPFAATPTGFQYRMLRSSSGGYVHLGNGTHNQSVSYDAFSFFCGTTITGSVSVYGYNR